MPLDPQARALLDQLAAAGGPDLSELAPDAARQMYEAMRAPERGEEMTGAESLRLASRGRTTSLRVYVPGLDRPLPALLYFRGGWVIGSLSTHDHLCRALARAATSALSPARLLAPCRPPIQTQTVPDISGPFCARWEHRAASDGAWAQGKRRRNSVLSDTHGSSGPR